ncbi:hypothetical protein ACNFCK_13555 [Pseudomonas sp. NY15366]
MKYAELERDRAATDLRNSVITFGYVAGKYSVEIIPTKAPGTQTKNRQELRNLLEFLTIPRLR